MINGKAKIQNIPFGVKSTLFQRWKSYVDPIFTFKLFLASIQRHEGDFLRWFNI